MLIHAKQSLRWHLENSPIRISERVQVPTAISWLDIIEKGYWLYEDYGFLSSALSSKVEFLFWSSANAYYTYAMSEEPNSIASLLLRDSLNFKNSLFPFSLKAHLVLHHDFHVQDYLM